MKYDALYYERRSAKHAGERDKLTGLESHESFRVLLGRILSSSASKALDANGANSPLAIVYFNIQNFKGYNEHYGYDAGNDLLVLITGAIGEAFPGAHAARFSADQFVVATTEEHAVEGIKQVRTEFRKHHMDSSIWLKAGIYVIRAHDVNPGVVCDRAKAACDAIKGRRDVFYRFYDAQLEHQIGLHRYVLDHFDEALEKEWVKVYYQPILRVATGEVCDEEALSRWVDPIEGLIPPLDFIPVLEEARLIHRLDLYMVRRACENFDKVRRDGMALTPVSINLSRLDFELCDIVSEVKGILDEFSVPHAMMAIEVTESALAGNQEFLKSEIDRFRAEGFEVWMDDFGSGYSSLHLLTEYNFDLVKVDMAFLRDFEKREEPRIMLAHIISMSKELGLKTLVEGVETQKQFDFLKAIGCGRAQGFLLGRPASLLEYEQATAADAYPPLELYEKRSFYGKIGRVNLMRPDPIKSTDGSYLPGDTPVSIVRRREGVYDYLNVSDAYCGFLEAMGVGSIEESTMRLNDPTRIEHVRLEEAVEACLVSGNWEWLSYYENGRSCSLRVRKLAAHESLDAIAVLVIADDVQQSVRSFHALAR